MYDELVKRLRNRRICIQQSGSLDDFPLLREAADAIEELTATAESYKRSMEAWADEAANAQPRWFPVTERLPESGVHVLAACRVKWLGGGGRSYVCDAFHTAPKTEVCNYSDDIDMEYDEETDEYYMPEGWWEVIKNWDDYSCVAIGDFVTHWMPLPEPPKEG